MNKPRIDMSLVTPKEQAKPSIMKAPEIRLQRLPAGVQPMRRTVTYSLREDVLELLHKAKYETGLKYNQIIENALITAYAENGHP